MEKYSNKKLPILVSCDLLESLNYCLFPNIHTLVSLTIRNAFLL